MLGNGMRKPSGGIEVFYIFFWVVYTIVKIDHIEYICSMHFNLCKSLLRKKKISEVSVHCDKFPARTSQHPLGQSQLFSCPKESIWNKGMKHGIWICIFFSKVHIQVWLKLEYIVQCHCLFVSEPRDSVSPSWLY